MDVDAWLDAADAEHELRLVLEGSYVWYGMPIWLDIESQGGAYQVRDSEESDGAGPERRFVEAGGRARAAQLLAGLLADGRPVRRVGARSGEHARFEPVALRRGSGALTPPAPGWERTARSRRAARAWA